MIILKVVSLITDSRFSITQNLLRWQFNERDVGGNTRLHVVQVVVRVHRNYFELIEGEFSKRKEANLT